MGTKNSMFDIGDYKAIVLDIFKKFLEICKEYDLQYFCCGGTAIGAIRHQGFIPWDDDIDVLMPRPDYDRFIRLFPDFKQNEYELHVPGKDAYYYFPFIKMCAKETTLLELSHIPYIIGVFIDIFPLDTAPTDLNKRTKNWITFRQNADKLMILSKPGKENLKWIFKRLYKGQYRYALNELECAFGKKRKYQRLNQKIRDITTIIPYEKGLFYGNYGGFWGLNEFGPKEWFASSVKKEFEGLSINLPVGYDKLLTQVYGDYMQLPPKEKRVLRHNPAYVDLYERKSFKEIQPYIALTSHTKNTI